MEDQGGPDEWLALGMQARVDKSPWVDLSIRAAELLCLGMWGTRCGMTSRETSGAHVGQVGLEMSRS